MSRTDESADQGPVGQPTTRRRRGRWPLRVALVAVAVPVSAFLIRWQTGNVGTVEPAAIYRSAQLSPRGLGRVIDRYQVQSVLNLRGANSDEPWYRAERQATLQHGASQVDFAMASDQWLSREQMVALVELIEGLPRPLLIHCEWGAERTGLASALATLLREGATSQEALAQFHWSYLYLPTADGLVMRGHLDAYREWLAREGLTHVPALLRRWAASAYQPGSPSRDFWPYDPYPLVVRTGRDGIDMQEQRQQ